jgi:NAD(P)-dependent dehydrogenase (short-subunit alcohol dehydrogenase family)
MAAITGPLVGRAFLVTGAGHGIGFATTKRLLSLGATVGLNDLRQNFVDEAVAAVAGLGGQAVGIVQDVSTRDGIRAAVQALHAHAGRLDGLVNNAAWVRSQNVADIAPATMSRMLAIGFEAVVWGIQAAAELMDKGAIVNIASIAGLRAAPNAIVYSGIKAGVMGITRAAAVDLGGRGIRVNAIAPSAVPTEGTMRNRNAERDAMRVASTPMGRLGTVDDIARAVCFLLSDESEFITGHILPVDGGITITAM